MEPSERSKDQGERLFDFTDEILVVCPDCKDCARVLAPGEATLFAPHRLVCGSCGAVKEWKGHIVSFDTKGHDPYFGLELWLRVRTGDGIIWAYNRRQLLFLRSYVAACHRERSKKNGKGWANKSLRSRLPAWVKRGSNREELLKKIDALLEGARNGARSS